MKPHIPLRRAALLILPLLFWQIPLEAQLQVRNAVGTTSSTAEALVDGNISTGWQSEGKGSSASFLLADPSLIEAEYSLTGPGEEQASYRLLGSINYRDWEILSEGTANGAVIPDQAVSIDPFTALYLRFISTDDTPATWELLVGSEDEVKSQLAQLRPVDWGDISDPTIILGLLDLAFDWQIANVTQSQDGTGWVTGAFHTGVSRLYGLTGHPKYRDAILALGNSVDWTLRLITSGKTFYHSDDLCLGQSWLELYLLDPAPQEIWIEDVKARLDRIMAEPLQGRVDMNWCDALYMSPPNYVRLAEITGNDAYRTFIDGQWWDVVDFLYDPQFQLFYRDASYIGDREPNGQPVFWSRGNGWVIAGVVRMLEYMPLDWPERPNYVNLLREMSSALADIQGPVDGLWSTSLLYPEKFALERETSGSAFFTYAMAWGVNEGVLDQSTYGPVIERAWEGLVSMLNADGTLDYIQQVGAGPALNNGQFLNKDYGYGAFILAGAEMIHYYANKQPAPAFAQQAIASTAAAPLSDGSTWTRVDDFEGSYSWMVRKDVPFSADLIEDPYDPSGNRVFSINTGLRTPGKYNATKPIPPIGNGTTATVYQRFAYDNPEIDVVFGISDESVIDAYADFENGLRVMFDYNQMEARAGGEYIRIGDDLIQLSTWYEAWTVINNATDTYDVYIRGGSNYPEQTLLHSGIPFRNGTASSIVSYGIAYNSGYCEGSFCLDDLYVDTTGLNLSRPQGVRQPEYSPWAEIPRGRPFGEKATESGYLWDNAYPWIYHAGMKTWTRVWRLESASPGLAAWRSTDQAWMWTSGETAGWFYDYASHAWIYGGR